jgi:amino acid transporter
MNKRKFSKIIKRELEVAFSKHAQPTWFRILKFVVLAFFIYFFWGSRMFWVILIILMILALLLHLWYRYKTRGWTKSYGGWDYNKNKPKSDP